MDNNNIKIYPNQPYRGIESFRFSDQEIFFGRKDETQSLLELVTIYKGTLMYGSSGSGKSSLISAGLIPEAIKKNFICDRIRVQATEGSELVIETIFTTERVTNDSQVLPSAFAEKTGKNAGKKTISLIEFKEVLTEAKKDWARFLDSRKPLISEDGKTITRLKPLAKPPVRLFIFDQFEEIITQFEDLAPNEQGYSERLKIQKSIFEALREAIFDKDTPVNFLFSFREDYLANLGVFLREVPTLRSQFLQLHPLKQASIRTIIEQPIIKEGIPEHFKNPRLEALVTMLTADFENKMASRRDNSTLLSEIQIVCQKLWNEKDNDPKVLYEGRKTDGILQDFFKDRMENAFPPDLKPVAQQILIQLVVNNVRNIVTKDALKNNIPGNFDQATFDRALNELKSEKRKLIKEDHRNSEITTYEIVSEFLIPYIRGIADKEKQKKEAQARRQKYLKIAGVIFVGLVCIACIVIMFALNRENILADKLAKTNAVLTDRTKQLNADSIVLRKLLDTTDEARKLAVTLKLKADSSAKRATDLSSQLEVDNRKINGLNLSLGNALDKIRDADSASAAAPFEKRNEDVFTAMDPAVKKTLFYYLFGQGRFINKTRADSVSTICRLAYLGRSMDSMTMHGFKAFFEDVRDAPSWVQSEQVLNNTDPFAQSPLQIAEATNPAIWGTSTTDQQKWGLNYLDIFYNQALWDIDYANQFMHQSDMATNPLARPVVKWINAINDSISKRNKFIAQHFAAPDTIIELPEKTLFSFYSADKNYYLWGYASTEDYRKKTLRIKGVQLNNFTTVDDTTIILSPRGTMYEVETAIGNYKYSIKSPINYVMSANMLNFDTADYTTPQQFKLTNKAGTELKDLTAYNAWSFSPAGTDMALNSKTSTDIYLYNINSDKTVLLPNSAGATDFSFSNDGKQIAWCGSDSSTIYFADMSGKITKEINLSKAGLSGVYGLFFISNNHFFRIFTKDSIYLYDIGRDLVLQNFSRKQVNTILVSPDGLHILIVYKINHPYVGDVHESYLTQVCDMNLNPEKIIYTACRNYYFTPDGQWLIGNEGRRLMRWKWSTIFNKTDPSYNSCLGPASLTAAKMMPFSYFMNSNDAIMVEKGAYSFKDKALKEHDTLQQHIYYDHAWMLFNRLANGGLINEQQEMRPFYYDWMNNIDRKLQRADYSLQLQRELKAVALFDRELNTADSVYTELPYHAAYGYELLYNLYDTLGRFDDITITEIKKSITFREKVVHLASDLDVNSDHLDNAFRTLLAVYDSMGESYLKEGKLEERLSRYKDLADYMSLQVLPQSNLDTLKVSYSKVLAEIATSYNYLYASNPEKYSTALDSSLYYINEGFQFQGKDDDYSWLSIAQAERCLFIADTGYQTFRDIYVKLMDIYPCTNLLAAKGEYPESYAAQHDCVLFQRLRRLKKLTGVNANIDKALPFVEESY